jgi:hypothetical protein
MKIVGAILSVIVVIFVTYRNSQSFIRHSVKVGSLENGSNQDSAPKPSVKTPDAVVKESDLNQETGLQREADIVAYDKQDSEEEDNIVAYDEQDFEEEDDILAYDEQDFEDEDDILAFDEQDFEEEADLR